MVRGDDKCPRSNSRPHPYRRPAEPVRDRTNAADVDTPCLPLCCLPHPGGRSSGRPSPSGGEAALLKAPTAMLRTPSALTARLLLPRMSTFVPWCCWGQIGGRKRAERCYLTVLEAGLLTSKSCQGHTPLKLVGGSFLASFWLLVGYEECWAVPSLQLHHAELCLYRHLALSLCLSACGHLLIRAPVILG